MSKTLRVAMLCVVVSVLGSCAASTTGTGAASDSSQTLAGLPAETTTAAVGAEQYESVVALRDAAIAAGYSCPNWEQTNHLPLAAQSGTCSSADVFSIFLSKNSMEEMIQNAKQLMEGSDTETTWLVGENWIINAPVGDLGDLKQELGGIMVPIVS